MSRERVAAALDRMARHPGVDSCALVDAAHGLVWYSAGKPVADGLWEAAADYWRLYARQREHFASLGALESAVLRHRAGVISVLPCCDEPALLLVSCGAAECADWPEWERKTRALGALIHTRHDAPLTR